ncbi:MAG TPA: ATP synthase F1 subunit delta [Acidimicrobiales bacterium]|nr:ATP synthase F1 subunit delta [Acidimicrobiales bacterium]
MLDDIVRGYAVAVAETARSKGHLERVDAELVTVQSALVTSDELRLALTDPALATIERRAIVADLLADRALSETADLVGFVVRVVRAGEVPVTIFEVELLIGFSLGAGDALIDDDTPAGRTGARARIRGYAERAFQELTDSAELDEVEDELFRFARVLEDNPNLRQVLEDTNFARDARIGVLTDLLGDRVQHATLRLCSYVLRAGRLRNLVGVFDWLVDLVAEERGRRIAEVRSAVLLSDEEQQRLSASLSRIVGRTVEVRVIIDESVIGGVLISTGDLFIDGTVRLRFERLRDVFAQQV